MSDSNPKMQPISWQDFHSDCQLLMRDLENKGQWKAIIAIARGGLVPAGIASHELNIRLVETICLASYDDANEQNEVIQLKGLSTEMLELIGDEGSNALVIDELVDKGKTAKAIRALLPKAHIATVYAKPTGVPHVDTFVKQFDQDIWLDFPWEL